MKNFKNIPNKISLDSSVILSYYLGEDLGKKARVLLFQEYKMEFFITLNGITEIFYILCRNFDYSIAKNKIETLINTNILEIKGSNELVPFVGKYKCERAISLSDSFVIGLAKQVKIAALFARKEQEIERELKRRPFDVDILFLEELDILENNE